MNFKFKTHSKVMTMISILLISLLAPNTANAAAKPTYKPNLKIVKYSQSKSDSRSPSNNSVACDKTSSPNKANSRQTTCVPTPPPTPSCNGATAIELPTAWVWWEPGSTLLQSNLRYSLTGIGVWSNNCQVDLSNTIANLLCPNNYFDTNCLGVTSQNWNNATYPNSVTLANGVDVCVVATPEGVNTYLGITLPPGTPGDYYSNFVSIVTPFFIGGGQGPTTQISTVFYGPYTGVYTTLRSICNSGIPAGFP